MKHYIFILISLCYSFSTYSSGLEQAKLRCAPPLPGESILYSDDFSWGMNLEQAKEAYEKVYYSDKRLKQRAYFDGENFVFAKALYNSDKDIRIPKNFIESITKHVESALKRNYVDFIIFPDMGHSHYFIPQEFYDNVLEKFSREEENLRYEAMFSHPGLKILYHTAEQFKMKDENKKLVNNRHMQWRYYTRNLVGDNKAQGHLEIIHAADNDFNTARDYDKGYKYWGSGFNISANQNGCFPFKYKGKTYYFDLSLKDLEPSSYSQSDSDWDFR